jgi:hypothetical protein
VIVRFLFITKQVAALDFEKNTIFIVLNCESFKTVSDIYRLTNMKTSTHYDVVLVGIFRVKRLILPRFTPSRPPWRRDWPGGWAKRCWQNPPGVRGPSAPFGAGKRCAENQRRPAKRC